MNTIKIILFLWISLISFTLKAAEQDVENLIKQNNPSKLEQQTIKELEQERKVSINAVENELLKNLSQKKKSVQYRDEVLKGLPIKDPLLREIIAQEIKENALSSYRWRITSNICGFISKLSFAASGIISFAHKSFSNLYQEP